MFGPLIDLETEVGENIKLENSAPVSDEVEGEQQQQTGGGPDPNGPCPPGVDCAGIAKAANEGLGYADYASTGLSGIQIGMSTYRQSLSINTKIGTFSRFSSTYRTLGTASKFLGHAGTAGTVLGVGLDYTAVQAGEIGHGRFTYRLGGAAASIFGGAAIGAEFGRHWGALGGALIGGLSWAGEQSYNGIVWFGNQLSQGMVQTENALKNGWYPGR